MLTGKKRERRIGKEKANTKIYKRQMWRCRKNILEEVNILGITFIENVYMYVTF